MVRFFGGGSYLHSTSLQVSQMLNVWYIYLHGWLILMVNVGRYTIHGSFVYHKRAFAKTLQQKYHPASSKSGTFWLPKWRSLNHPLRIGQAGSLLGCPAGSDGNDRDGKLLLVGGGFKYLLFSPPTWGYFSDGLKPPTRLVYFTYLWTLQPTDRNDKSPLTIPIVTSSTSRTSQYTTQKTNLFVDPQIFHPQKRTQENIHQSPNLQVGVSVASQWPRRPHQRQIRRFFGGSIDGACWAFSRFCPDGPPTSRGVSVCVSRFWASKRIRYKWALDMGTPWTPLEIGLKINMTVEHHHF